MEFDSEIIKFHIYDTMRFPSDTSQVSAIDVIDPLFQEFIELNQKDELKIVLEHNLTLKQMQQLNVNEPMYREEIRQAVSDLDSLGNAKGNEVSFELNQPASKPVPSIV